MPETPQRRVSFELGQLQMTRHAMDTLSKEDAEAALRRHARGDWGDVGEEDHHCNERALTDGSRIFSVYHAKDGTKFWIITEGDRSVTTILLPSDY